jgi:arylsulfatase A-like enzyme
LSSAFSKLKGYRISRIVQDRFGEFFPRGIPQTGDHMYLILEDAVDWISNKMSQIPEPFFGYVHLWPPHDPYRTRLEFVDTFLDGWLPPHKEEHVFSQGHSDELLSENRRFYDEYIAYVDAEFGRLFSVLERAGILESTIILLSSDHGEIFERGIYGHLTPALFEPLIRIPLLVFSPNQIHRKDIFTPTSSTDILPTICKWTGKEIPDWIEGCVLPPFNDAPVDREVYAMDSKHIPQSDPFNKGSIAIIRDQYKLVQYSGYEGASTFYELYDLENDPEEMADIYQNNMTVAKSLKANLTDKLTQINQRFY